MLIANPIYDTAFKRLMENQSIAKFFISTVIEQEVVELEVKPQEHTYKFVHKSIAKRMEIVRKYADVSVFRME